jgi:hypothetical protein
MKVDSKNLVEVFNEVKYLLDGMADAIRMGDDGFENDILSLGQDIKTVINVFTIEHMTPVTKPDKEPQFLKRHVELHDKANEGAGMTPDENIQLFKARFYLFIKKALQDIDLQLISNLDLHNAIMDKVVIDSRYYSYFNTDFDRAAYNVLDLIADEIRQHRKRHPQLSMNFEKPTEATKSKKLVDLI